MPATVPAQKKTHAHHWRIDEVDGPVSEGYCLQCGAKKEFRNYPNDEPMFSQPYGRRRSVAA